jgi:hypothetical protein
LKRGSITGFFLALFLVSATGMAFSPLENDSLRKKKRTKLFAVPTLGSAPETGFYGGAVALIDFVPGDDSLARHSVLKTEVTYTAKKQFVLNLDWIITDSLQKQIFLGDNAWMRFPELFWGKGGKTPKSNEVLYDAFRLELNNTYLRRIQPHFYLGVSQQFQSVYKMRFPFYETPNSEVYREIETGKSSGLGLAILYDSRTNLLNPRPGEAVVSVQSLGFGTVLGSDFSFASLDADFRYYHKTGRKQLIAFQGFTQLRSEGAPYRMLSLLGGPMILRGYYQGRFRDNNLFAAQTEWRWDFSKWFGMTAFGAFGDVVSFKNPERNGSLKSAAGLGLRIKVDQKENTNMRFDFALTNEQDFGFYVSFGEAF